MKFDIILHGKPNAGSFKATNGVDDTFCQNLVDKFFQSMAGIRESETLIVDVRNWKGTWYGVYTFWLGCNITDTAGRSSFLAISIVVPNQYFCLVSTVYDIFEKVYKENVIGTYISENGKYLVRDFSDNVAFEKLVVLINSGFVNLGEEFDDSFKLVHENASNNNYSLLDCDSKAFVEDLKKYGRILVSKTYESKDERLTKANQFYPDLQKAKLELELKKSQIEKLSKRVTELETQIDSKNSKTSDALASLKQQINTLKDEKDRLTTSISALNQKNIEYQEKEKQIAKLLGIKAAELTTTHEPEKTPAPQIKIKNIIPIVNTLLLVILLGINCFKSCNSSIHKDIADNSDVEELQHPTGVESMGDASSGGNELDVDCGLIYFQDNTLVAANNIDPTKLLTIYVQKSIDGYRFYTDNLEPNISIRSGKPFSLTKQDQSKPIIISYGSEDIGKRNDNNVLTIN